MSGIEETDFTWSSSGVSNITTEDNSTLSCAARYIQGPNSLPYSHLLLTVVRVFQSLFWIVLFLGGIFLNVFVIVLVAKYKRLQVLSFGLAIQIIVQDLFLTFAVSSGFVSSIANRWIFGEHVCAIVGSIVLLSATVRNSILTLFIVDRFVSVFVPFNYPKYRTKVVIVCSIGVWLFGCLLGILGYVLDCYRFNPRTWICFYSGTCNTQCSQYIAFVNSLFIILGMIIPIVLYIILFIKAKKAKRAMAGLSQRPETDWKATITFFLLFLTVFIVVMPNVILGSITSVVYSGKRQPPFLHVISIITASMNSLITITDPILCMRNKDVREVINEIFSKIKMKFQKQVNTEQGQRSNTMETAF